MAANGRSASDGASDRRGRYRASPAGARPPPADRGRAIFRVLAAQRRHRHRTNCRRADCPAERVTSRRARRALFSAGQILDPDGFAPIEDDLRDQCGGYDLQVGALCRRVQERSGGRCPNAVLGRYLIGGDAFLSRTIVVGGSRVAGLPGRVQKNCRTRDAPAPRCRPRRAPRLDLVADNDRGFEFPFAQLKLPQARLFASVSV